MTQLGYEWRDVHGSNFFQHSISGLMSFQELVVTTRVTPDLAALVHSPGTAMATSPLRAAVSPAPLSPQALLSWVTTALAGPGHNLLACADLPTFGADALLEPRPMHLPSMCVALQSNF